MLNYILILHLLGATVWTGGHLILTLVVLPKALLSQNIDGLRQFEQLFERIGMPALVLQIITGFWMAYQLLPNIAAWFKLDNDFSILISLKLITTIANDYSGCFTRSFLSNTQTVCSDPERIFNQYHIGHFVFCRICCRWHTLSDRVKLVIRYFFVMNRI